MCDYDCLCCPEIDCISDNPPIVDLDVYLQFSLDIRFKGIKTVIFKSLDVPEEIKNMEIPIIEKEIGLFESQDEEFRNWCESHNVVPRVRADVEILKRAIEQGFQGKKLEKAIYKVRHRELYLLQKKRYRKRRKLFECD